MHRRSAVRLLAAGSAGLLLPARISRALSAEATFRSESRLVLLDVSVKDRQGQFVSGLSRNNFRISEDGKAQHISVFEPEDGPVDIGILIDGSRSMLPRREAVIAAGEAFLAASNSRDQVFVLHFSETVISGLPAGVPFSPDPKQLRAALLRTIPPGRTALYDAIFAGLEHLRLGREGRKAVVIISDGGDTASKHSRHDTVRLMESGFASVFAIGLAEPNSQDNDPGFLRRLAQSSGGAAFFPTSPAEFTPLCTQIARDIRARYAVGYVPQPGRTATRTVAVEVTAPNRGQLRVQARRHYRYDEPFLEQQKP